MVNYLNKHEVNQIILDPNNKTINFDQIKRIDFPRVDINNCVITGTVIKGMHSFGKGNMLNCELRDLNAVEIDFEYVDIKDLSTESLDGSLLIMSLSVFPTFIALGVLTPCPHFFLVGMVAQL